MVQPTVVVSSKTYAETLTQLKNTIAHAGARLFAEIDQSAAARNVGLTLRPTTLLIFGNPEAGTPLMEVFPLAGLDLPLKILVWEEKGAVSIAYVPARAIIERYGVFGKDPVLTAMDGQLEKLTLSILS